MNQQDFRKRISGLRNQKGVSAREMSIALGQSSSYINGLENGSGYPSMQMFFMICDYFGITPRDFFMEEIQYVSERQDLLFSINALDKKDYELLKNLVWKLSKK